MFSSENFEGDPASGCGREKLKVPVRNMPRQDPQKYYSKAVSKLIPSTFFILLLLLRNNLLGNLVGHAQVFIKLHRGIGAAAA